MAQSATVDDDTSNAPLTTSTELAEFLDTEVQKHPNIGENQQALDMFNAVISVLRDTDDEKEDNEAAFFDKVADALLEMSSFSEKNSETSSDVSQVVSALVDVLPKQTRSDLVARANQWKSILEFVNENYTVYKFGEPGYAERRCQYALCPDSYPEDHLTPGYISVVSNLQGIIDTINDPLFHGKLLAIRTGGHQYSGFSSTTSENVLIDLAEKKPFDEHEYDEENNILYSGVSFRLKEWLEENSEKHIMLPTGVCSNVHLGGHVHTGGIGQYTRAHGLLIDYVMGFRTVLADGKRLLLVVRPSFRDANPHIVEKWEAESHPFVIDASLNDDLFFGTLGGTGGGDLGIVTGFYFQPVKDSDYLDPVGWSYTWVYSEFRLRNLCDKISDLTQRAERDELPPDFDVMVTTFSVDGIPTAYYRHQEAFVEKWNFPIGLKAIIIVAITSNEFAPVAKGLADELINAGMAGGGIPFPGSGIIRGITLSKLMQKFLFDKPREFEYPYLRCARGTDALLQPGPWVQSMTNFTHTVVQSSNLLIGTQLQVYAGRNTKLATGDPHHETALPVRHAAMGVTYPIFYKNEEGKTEAENIRTEIGNAWVGDSGLFTRVEYRLFAFTWGDRDMSNPEVQAAYYRDEELYQRIVAIKREVDADGRLNSNPFAVRP